MIGKLVAIRIDESGTGQDVTGLVAQPKNRKAAWHFHLEPGEEYLLLEKVAECEAKRKAENEA